LFAELPHSVEEVGLAAAGAKAVAGSRAVDGRELGEDLEGVLGTTGTEESAALASLREELAGPFAIEGVEARRVGLVCGVRLQRQASRPLVERLVVLDVHRIRYASRSMTGPLTSSTGNIDQTLEYRHTAVGGVHAEPGSQKSSGSLSFELNASPAGHSTMSRYSSGEVPRTPSSRGRASRRRAAATETALLLQSSKKGASLGSCESLQMQEASKARSL
jgi:hypothetical protein